MTPATMRYGLLAVALLVALGSTIYLNGRYQESQATAVADKFQLLASLRRSALETYFNTARAEISFWALSDRIHRSMLALTAGWMELGVDPGEEVRRLYLEQSDPLAALRVIENAGDGSAYSDAHAELHAFAREFVTERGYYDFFLIDMDGNIVYSVEKEADFGTSLVDGPYESTGLGDVFSRLTAEGAGSSVVLSDFESYAPSNGAPAIFAGELLQDKAGRKLGVLALQLPSDTIQTIMRFTGGMGDSGETYLVGEDRLMRSDSRFSEQSTVLSTMVDTETVSRALAGEQGVGVVADYRGIDVLSAYDFIEFDGNRWAVMAEIDVAEVEHMVGSIFSELIAAALAFAALFLVTAWSLRDLSGSGVNLSDTNVDIDPGA